MSPAEDVRPSYYVRKQTLERSLFYPASTSCRDNAKRLTKLLKELFNCWAIANEIALLIPGRTCYTSCVMFDVGAWLFLNLSGRNGLISKRSKR